jgi:hypothetical protein
MTLQRKQFQEHLERFTGSAIHHLDLHEHDEAHPQWKALVSESLPVRAFEDPGVARGNCIGAACSFNRALEDHGVAPRKITYRGPEGFYDRFDTRTPIHDVSEIDVEGVPHVVDFTHRQFDQKADFPVVEPRAEFDKRMRRMRFTPGDVQYSGEDNW